MVLGWHERCGRRIQGADHDVEVRAQPCGDVVHQLQGLGALVQGLEEQARPLCQVQCEEPL
jgi:hypothetical protein